MLTEQEEAELRIRRVIELWVLARDAADWPAFASVWHDDGWIPAGYQHLAYVQTHLGFQIAPRLPGLRGPEVELLYREGRDWQNGSPRPGLPTATGLVSPAADR
jgi:hypothetical protein